MKAKRKVTSEMIKEYEKLIQKEQLKTETRRKYLVDVWKLEEYLDGQELTQELLVEYPKWLLHEKKYKKRSVNAIVVSTRKFLYSMGWTDFRIRGFTLDNNERKAMNRYISRKEYDQIVITAMNQKNYWIAMLVQTLCHMDIRYSELENLTLDTIRNKEVAIARRQNIVFLVIPEALAESLLLYAKQEGISEGSVFQNSAGKMPDRSNIWREIKLLCKEAGLDSERINMQKFKMPLMEDYYPFYPIKEYIEN